MRSAALIELLSFTTLVIALPAAETVSTDTTTHDLIWYGQVEVDGPEIRLTGDAESIRTQILELNPKYESQLGVSKVVARQNRPIFSDSIQCNPPILWCPNVDVQNGINYLYWLGGGLCAASPGRPGRGGCSRVACNNSSAIWFCNDLNFELRISCFLMADNARGIKDRCTVHPDMSRGHISAFDRNWGVAVGYGDCQNPPGERPWN